MIGFDAGMFVTVPSTVRKSTAIFVSVHNVVLR